MLGVCVLFSRHAPTVQHNGRLEFRRYLDIARGSLAEVSYLLLFSRERGIVDDETLRRLSDLRDHASKLIWGLYMSLAPNKPR